MALFKKDRDRQSVPSDTPTNKGGTDAIVGSGDESDPARNEERTMAGQGSAAERMGVGGESAVLGRGTRISGKISFEGKARIDGQVEGEIIAGDYLEIGQSALVNAQINGSIIVVQGKVTGDLTASKKLEIRAPGRLYGNVTTPSLVIEEGVIFEGHCSMGAKEGRSGDRVTILAKEEAPSEQPVARAAAAGEKK
jgi:cytoskeletal protein CcmA (bactofilin family)